MNLNLILIFFKRLRKTLFLNVINTIIKTPIINSFPIESVPYTQVSQILNKNKIL